MPRTLNEDEAASQGTGPIPSPADETRGDDEQSGETGAAVKRLRVLVESSDDDNSSSSEGDDLNPS